jgi:NAD(P)-dependent dehydrogenase (short-subunit alcohol dehydrogenase family)
MAVVLITGCSSGFGLETAVGFAQRGDDVIATMRDPARAGHLQQRTQSLPGKLAIERLDVTDQASIDAAIGAALERFGYIDVLVNNAGVGWMGRLQEMPEDKVEELVATNLKGVIVTTQAALPAMLARRRGVIINVASVVGFRASPYSAVYSATKHAVVGLSHALRGELSGTGVKVCVVYPGVTDTEFFESTEAPVGPKYSASWVANLIVRTAQFPRRDAMVMPLRLAHLAEPLLGGLMDHSLGEARRLKSPHLSGTGLDK